MLLPHLLHVNFLPFPLYGSLSWSPTSSPTSRFLIFTTKITLITSYTPSLALPLPPLILCSSFSPRSPSFLPTPHDHLLMLLFPVSCSTHHSSAILLLSGTLYPLFLTYFTFSLFLLLIITHFLFSSLYCLSHTFPVEFF